MTRITVLLKTDYGALEIFSAKQVAATIERHKLGPMHHLYAVALFSPASEFESNFEGSETNISCNATRQEIADIYFNGDSNFNIPKITSVRFHVGGSSESGGSFGGSGFGAMAMVVRTIFQETPHTLTPYNQTLQSDNLTAA